MQSNMDDKVYDNYRNAGEIAAKARDYGIDLIKEGVGILEVVNKIESKILENGAGLAFPVNISINEVAAHFSPRHDDSKLIFKKGDVIKLDVGAHIDGYIADTAYTVEIRTNNHEDLIKASQDALKNAIGLMKANVNLVDVGKAIEDTISSYGYKSIDNLTGHSLDRYNLHSGLSIPNVSKGSNRTGPLVGEVIAIEPFASKGTGHVTSGESSNIYRYSKSTRSKIIRDPKTKFLTMKISNKFNSLPFAERWCIDIIPKTDILLRRLLFAGCIKQYPQLIDSGNGIVSQAEHTVIINEDGCEVTT